MKKKRGFGPGRIGAEKLALATLIERAYFQSVIAGVLLGRLIEVDPLFSLEDTTREIKAKSCLSAASCIAEAYLSEVLNPQQVEAMRRDYLEEIMFKRGAMLPVLCFSSEHWRKGITLAKDGNE